MSLTAEPGLSRREALRLSLLAGAGVALGAAGTGHTAPAAGPLNRRRSLSQQYAPACEQPVSANLRTLPTGDARPSTRSRNEYKSAPIPAKASRIAYRSAHIP